MGSPWDDPRTEMVQELAALREENERLKAQIGGRTLVPELVELQREIARLTHNNEEWRDAWAVTVRERDEWRDTARSEMAGRAAAEAENARLRAALEHCRGLFNEIRSDWSDPRTECRGGVECIDTALAPEGKR